MNQLLEEDEEQEDDDDNEEQEEDDQEDYKDEKEERKRRGREKTMLYQQNTQTEQAKNVLAQDKDGTVKCRCSNWFLNKFFRLRASCQYGS